MDYQKHIEAIDKELLSMGIDLRDGRPEKSFAHKLGFGGKVDWHAPGIVIDFKSKDSIGEDRLAWDEHVCQLASYREGLGMPTARCLNVFVGIDDCRVEVVEHSEQDLQRGWRMFQHCLGLWKEKKNYYPGESVEDKLDRAGL